MRRSRFVTNAFLCIYLFYSLFPLLYGFEVSVPENQLGSKNIISATALGRWEQGSLFTLAADQSDDGPSRSFFYVLLKKKRAIPISFKLDPQLAGSFPAYASFPDKKVAADLVPDRLYQSSGFRFYHSGISPPSV